MSVSSFPPLPSLRAVLFVAPLFALLGPLAAQPPADTATRFVERLREEGHDDLVEEFLERAETDPLVSDEFRARIPVERAAGLLAKAARISDPEARRESLADAVDQLKPLAETNDAAADLLIDASDRLATAMADVARREAIEADRITDEAVRKNRLTTARRRLRNARGALQDVEQQIVAARERLKGVQPTSPEGRRRSELGARLGVVRLLAARLLHEQASTFSDRSAEAKRLNREAAEELGALYEKYSRLGIGLYAHLYEGRCYRLLGETALATAALEDLTYQPAETADLRRVVTLAQAELAALWTDTGKPAEALKKPREWLERLGSGESRGLEAATLQYHLALAALQEAESAEGRAATSLRRDARDWLQASARVPSEVQSDARQRWTDVTATLGLTDQPPKSFDEALQNAKEAVAAIAAADVALAEAAPGERDRLQSQRDQSRDAATAALQAARDLANRRTDPEEVADALYLMTWLDWDAGKMADVADRAAKVARERSDTAAGPKAARLALAALEQLARAGGASEASRLDEFATFVVAQWPETEVAQAAATVRVTEAIRRGDLAAGQRVLAEAPRDLRAGLALRMALAQWERAPADGKPIDALRAAFEPAAAADSDSPLCATAALYLAQDALQRGDADAAGKLLNHPKYGPATRVRDGAPPANTPAFALAALRLATRVAARRGADVADGLARFEEVLATAPAEQTGGDTAWLALAVELMADLDASDGTASSVAAALSAVLDRLDGVEASADWNTRLWIAQARLRCGEALGQTDAGKASVADARDALTALVERAESTPGFAPSATSVLAARLRLAECQSALGEYADAFESLVTMLEGGAVLLDVQRLAAQTLHDWGVAERDAARFEQAIAGARPGADGKNVVWGFSKLASIAGRFAASDPGRRGLYFDAWRGVAECRYQSAMLQSGPQRTEQLRKATATIRAVQRQNPELGGPEQRRAYDALLRRIQQAAGDRVVGLGTQSGGAS